MTDNQESGVERSPLPVDDIDGMDFYGVRIHVHGSDFDEGRIEIELLHGDAPHRNSQTDLYYAEEEWRCSLCDNYAVVDKALNVLNDTASTEI